MPHIGRNISLVLVIMLLCLMAIFPVDKKLRLGKDLAGGVSLVYTVQVDPDDPPDTIDRTIDVLKERVDPKGLFEITMVRQGRDRIEISFPLPNERVKQLRAEYDAKVAQLEAYRIDPDAFERMMRLEGERRTRAISDLIGGSEVRQSILEPVILALEKSSEARRDFEEVRAAEGADPADINEFLDRAAEAELAVEEARRRALSSLISPEDVRAALELSDDAPKVRDSRTKQVLEMDSPRQRALSVIRERLGQFEGGVEVLDDIIAAHGAYANERRGFDDPNELIRLLQGAGVLEFRIGVAPGSLPDEDRLRRELIERGPDYVQSTIARWYPINKIDNWFSDTDSFQTLRDDPAGYFRANYRLIAEERQGVYYLLLSNEPQQRLTKAEGEWSVVNAGMSSDDLGRPAVTFRMDPRGARLLSNLTEPNVNRQMAVLLDDEVFTAPNIRQRLSDTIQISGSFSQQEIQYLIRTLNAGSLSARLGDQPISKNNLAPSLGLDNLRKGLTAAYIAFFGVAAFMIFYYFSNGWIAVFALLCNAIILLGVMSLARAAFTLPGIAGVILTFGMAVDANVLIYERIREELVAGRDLRTAVRLGFQKVFSTIVDANITNLIICFVLAYTGTPEIKGFAITLGIGIVSTLFTALVVTRIIFSLLVDHIKIRRMRQLPLVVPVIDRILTPKIDFVALRPLFLVISAVLVGTGFYMIYQQRGELLGTEFRGGTEVTLQLREDVPPLTRAEAQERVSGVVTRAQERLAQNPADEIARVLAQLVNASVVVVNPEADGITSRMFKISTTIAEDPSSDVSEERIFGDAMTNAFVDVLDAPPALSFRMSNETDVDLAPVYQIIDPSLGRNIGRDEIQNPVERYVGGVAILIEDFEEPLPSKAQLVQRLEFMRSQADFADTLSRAHDLIVLEGTDSAVESAVVLVVDPGTSFFTDESRWKLAVAQREWNLVRNALTVAQPLAGVQSFSAAIAATFKAQAIVAVSISFLLILIYIWVRFGSVRYSMSAIVALLHDVITAVGLIAMAEILYKNFPAVAAIGIQPFKIDLGLVAAILTIIGYSLNDTIVILDRVRENRGKLAYASREVINTSISQTISRTVITSGTTLIALGVMFVVGGEGIASFTYAMFCGVIIGTYSSIAVAAPLVYTSKIPPSSARRSTPDTPSALDAGRDAPPLPSA